MDDKIKKTASGIWDKIENTMKEVYDYSKKAFEKTSDYGKIGVKTVELKILQSSAQQHLSELGMKTFKLLAEKKEDVSLSNPEINEIVEKIIEIDKEIDEKEAEIEAIKKDEDDNDEEDKKQIEE